MQELSVLLTLAAVFAVALVSPGPDVALVVRTSLHQGRRAGLASALGLACGILLHTTLVLTGVSLLLSRTPVLFAILQAPALGRHWLASTRSRLVLPAPEGPIRATRSPAARRRRMSARARWPSAWTRSTPSRLRLTSAGRRRVRTPRCPCSCPDWSR